MKIHEYNEMMAYLTRPAVNRTRFSQGTKKVAGLMEEYYGSDQLKYQEAVRNGFQGTFEEYLQWIRKNAAQGGVIGKGGMFQGEDLGYRTGFVSLKDVSNPGERSEGLKRLLPKNKKNYISLIELKDLLGAGAEDMRAMGGSKDTVVARAAAKLLDQTAITGPGRDLPTSKKYFFYKKPTAKELELLKTYIDARPIRADMFQRIQDLQKDKYTAQILNDGKLPMVGKGKQKVLDPKFMKHVRKNYETLDKYVHGLVRYTQALDGQTIIGLNDSILSDGKFKTNKKIANKIRNVFLEMPYGSNNASMNTIRKAVYKSAMLDITNELGNTNATFEQWKDRIRRKINKTYKLQGADIHIDELIGVSSSMRNKTAPYAVFTQLATKELNEGILKDYQKVLSNHTAKLKTEIAKNSKFVDGKWFHSAEAKKIVNNFNKNILPNLTNIDQLKGTGFTLPEMTLGAPTDRTLGGVKGRLATLEKAGLGFKEFYQAEGFGYKMPKNVATQKEVFGNKKVFVNQLRNLLQSADKPTIMKIRKALKCPSLKSSGGRVGFALGGNLLDCPMAKLAQDPEGTLNKVGQAMPETRTPIMNAFKKLGTPLKWAGNTFNVGLGPTGVVGLNYFLGVDPTETSGRIGLEAEVAFAKPLVEGAKSVTDKIKTPFLRKAAETAAGIRIPGIMTPANALRLARIASPIGWAALGVEGLYHGGKYMLERKKLLESLTDEQRDELLRKEKQEAVMQQTRGDPEAFDYLAAAEGGRVGFGAGGKLGLAKFIFTTIRDLYKGKKGLQAGGIRKKLIKEYKEKGVPFDEYIGKVYDEAEVIVDNRKLDIVEDAMKKVDIRSDDYVKLMDEHIRLTDDEMYKDIKRWDEYRPDLSAKVRARHDPYWAEVTMGENYDEVLLRNQTQALKAQSDEIDRMYPADDPDVGPSFVGEQQMVDEIDEMNKANLAELLEGKKKHAVGGRVGFKDGSPKSPGRRAFIKGITALAALPVVGKFFKLGKVLEAGQYTGPAIQKIKGMPEWFPSLVKKLWNEGEDVTKTASWKERQVVKRGTLEGGDEVDMIYDMDTGNVSIEVNPKKGSYETTSGAYNKEYGLDYTKGQADEMTKGKKPPDEFSVGELEPRQTGPQDVELDGTMTTVDDAFSDLTELEAFAKNKTTKQIHKKKGTKPKDVNPDWEPPDYDPY